MSRMTDDFGTALRAEDHGKLSSKQEYKVANAALLNQFFVGNPFRDDDVVQTQKNQNNGISLKVYTAKTAHSGRAHDWKAIEGRARNLSLYSIGLTTDLKAQLSPHAGVPEEVQVKQSPAIPIDAELKALFREVGIQNAAPEGTMENIIKTIEKNVRDEINMPEPEPQPEVRKPGLIGRFLNNLGM